MTVFRDTKGALYVNPTGQLATYSSASGYALAADGSPFQLSGAAGKIIKVRRITFGFFLTTALYYQFAVLRNTASLTGSANACPIIPLDSADPASAAGVSGWTASTIPGGGQIVDFRKPFAGDATHPAEFVVIDFGGSGCKPLVLRSAAEFMQLSINSLSYAGAIMNASVLWTEESA